jgi:hypothetical protein
MAGNTVGRGYGAEHVRLRKAYAAIVAAGRARCTRCGLPIAPWAPWDLDHSEDRSRWLGPAHRSCNRSAGARKKQKMIKGRQVLIMKTTRPTVIDRW